MPTEDGPDERRLLVGSMIAAGAIGGVGVVAGIVIGSQMILLDGIYSFVGIALSGLLLWASALAEKEPSRRFPFGLHAATPLAISIQAFVLLATLLYAAAEAVYAIRDGGVDVTAGWGIAYGALVAIVCVGVAVWIGRGAGHSDVLASEAAAWRVAAWRGVGMIVGFGLLAIVVRSRWSEAAPYIDPAMVIVSCAALVGTPLGLLRGTLVELLEGAPADDTAERVRTIVDEVRTEFGLDEPTVYLSKVGPKLYLEVATTAAADTTIGAAHAVRESLRDRLDELPYEVWLNVELVPRPVAG